MIHFFLLFYFRPPVRGRRVFYKKVVMKNSKYLKALFPYFGGKSLIADTVWHYLGNVKTYIEPFFGSGAVLLRRPPTKREKIYEIICDKDGFIANWQINSITREDGGLLLSASREGKEAGYAIVTNLGDGIFELNEIRVNDTFKRQGLGTELYRNAAQKVKALGGKLYTSPEMTDAGKALRDSIDKAGGLGNNTRVKGAYRREVLSSFNPPAATSCWIGSGTTKGDSLRIPFLAHDVGITAAKGSTVMTRTF